MNLEFINKPLSIEEIDFRIQSINKGGYARILAYKNARCDMKRLDQAFGVFGWQKKYSVVCDNLYCEVGIQNPETNEWIWKSDVGIESYTEKEKGQASDAFKRACFNIGIGRELYDYPIINIKLNNDEWELYQNKPKPTWNLRLNDWIWFSQFTDNKLNYLACKDFKGKLRYEYGNYIKEKTGEN